MPNFVYEAYSDTGKTLKGSITAPTNEEALARIRAQGYYPKSLREQKTKKSKGPGAKNAGKAGPADSGEKKKAAGPSINISIPGFDKVKNKHLTLFTRQLSTLQDAGLPILRSLAVLEQQQKPGPMKTALAGVYEDVSSGASLSDAMGKHPKAFNPLYVKMIAAGEVGGVLDVILQRLAEFLEKAEKLKKRIISAMTYPAAVIGIATVIVFGIMIVIVPKFIEIFDDFDTDLPYVTIQLIEFSKWLGGPILPENLRDPSVTVPGLVWMVFIPPGLIMTWKLIRKADAGKRILDEIVLKVPVLGGLVRKATIAKFTRTLGTLITAGVPILDAIRITSETTGNEKYVRALQDVHASVRGGDSFAEPLRKAKVVDLLVVNMIDVGEETGDLDKMLLKVADNYDEEVDVAVASLVSLLEPIMIVVLGVIILGIVLALFLPMVAIMTSLTGG
ncbi:MAG: type II secretion system F family protein [Planctomycetota bacterium]